jgi:predicted ATPase
MRTLEKITINNFKSIREQTLALRKLNVFIGSNGVGKSNLIGVFRLLQEIVNQNLQGYIGRKGGADSFLYFGRKRSPEMSIFLEFGETGKSNSYEVKLAGTADDTLFISSEEVYYHAKSMFPHPLSKSISHNVRESELKKVNHMCPRQVISDLESYSVYHFHDTSDTAKVKDPCDLEDNRYLHPQAENLAAFLYWLQQKKTDNYANIRDVIRQIAPFFDDFRLAPSKLNENKIRIEWKEKGSDSYFNASSLSDGTLRFMCLATLLLQPDLPSVILLDEPELGLHPAAVALLAELLESASTKTQVIVATQSVTLVNHFDIGVVWAVDRVENQSVFKKLDQKDMESWIDGYALGELWEKNLLGARP